MPERPGTWTTDGARWVVIASFPAASAIWASTGAADRAWRIFPIRARTAKRARGVIISIKPTSTIRTGTWTTNWTRRIFPIRAWTTRRAWRIVISIQGKGRGGKDDTEGANRDQASNCCPDLVSFRGCM